MLSIYKKPCINFFNKNDYSNQPAGKGAATRIAHIDQIKNTDKTAPTPSKPKIQVKRDAFDQQPNVYNDTIISLVKIKDIVLKIEEESQAVTADSEIAEKYLLRLKDLQEQAQIVLLNYESKDNDKSIISCMKNKNIKHIWGGVIDKIKTLEDKLSNQPISQNNIKELKLLKSIEILIDSMKKEYQSPQYNAQLNKNSTKELNVRLLEIVKKIVANISQPPNLEDKELRLMLDRVRDKIAVLSEHILSHNSLSLIDIPAIETTKQLPKHEKDVLYCSEDIKSSEDNIKENKQIAKPSSKNCRVNLSERDVLQEKRGRFLGPLQIKLMMDI